MGDSTVTIPPLQTLLAFLPRSKTTTYSDLFHLFSDNIPNLILIFLLILYFFFQVFSLLLIKTNLNGLLVAYAYNSNYLGD
jgi:hypothetical protein